MLLKGSNFVLGITKDKDKEKLSSCFTNFPSGWGFHNDLKKCINNGEAV